MTAEIVRIRTIHRVFKEFLDWRGPTLEAGELDTYRETLASFERSINAHGARRLEPSDKSIFRTHFVPGKGYRRAFSDVFGPEKIPAEIRYFLKDFLFTMAPRADVIHAAPNVVADLCAWLVFQDYVPDEELEQVIDRIGASTSPRDQDSVNF